MVRRCKICNKPFEGHYRKNAVFCSQECRDKWIELYKTEKADKNPRSCKCCGKKFIPDNYKRKFCSKICRRKSEREQSRKAQQARKVKGDNSAWYRLRFSIMARDGFRCQYCGRTVQDEGVKLVIDHILAKTNGGLDDPSNLITSCSDCNVGKSGLFLITKDGKIPTYLTFKILSSLPLAKSLDKNSEKVTRQR